MAPLECLHPPVEFKVMNFVAEDGTLLFAGEWSGAASQVSYSVPFPAEAPPDTQEGEAEEATEPEPVTEAESKDVEKTTTQPSTAGLSTNASDLSDLADSASASRPWLMAYMVQSDDRVELIAMDFVYRIGRQYRLVYGGEGIPILPQWSPDATRIFFYYLPQSGREYRQPVGHRPGGPDDTRHQRGQPGRLRPLHLVAGRRVYRLPGPAARRHGGRHLPHRRRHGPKREPDRVAHARLPAGLVARRRLYRLHVGPRRAGRGRAVADGCGRFKPGASD